MTLTLNHRDTPELNRRFVGRMRPGALIKIAAPGTERPAAGWYQSSTGDITLDDSIEFDAALTIDGLIEHEASHSVWSNWLTLPFLRSGQATDAEVGVLKLLEEARIEAKAVDAHSFAARMGLRSCYGFLLADGFADEANYVSVAGAVSCWALCWGRVHSGVVDPDELDVIDAMMRDRFGDYPMDLFDDLLGEYVSLGFGSYMDADKVAGAPVPRRAIRIAKEWLELVKSLQKDEGEMDTETIIIEIVERIIGDEAEGSGKGSGDGSGDGEGKGESSGAGESGEGEGEGESKGSGESKSEGESEETGGGHGDGGGGERYGWAEEFVEAVKGVCSDPGRDATVRRMSNRDRLAQIWKSKKSRSSRNWFEMAPEARHRHLIVRFAKALERDATPAVVRTRIASQIPPGRLNGRGAMAAAADRAGGRMTAATPWRANRRHHVERPPVIIGLATDTSGSMSEYTRMLGEVAYVTAHASKRVNAKFAAVTFGARAEPVVALGETPSMIRVRSANSPHEAFDDAMASLDGPLRLTDRSVIGRKLLIVVSDAELVRPHERDKALLWLKELNASGVDVIWVGAACTGAYRTVLVKWAEEDNLKVTWVPSLSTAEEFVDGIMANLRSA